MQENPQPDAEINVDGVVFSDEVKRAYEGSFLQQFCIGNKKVIQCTEELQMQLKRIVSLLGYGKVTLGSYVQSILDFHLEEHKIVIAELKATSLLATAHPEAIDGISLSAKKYQAMFLTGDYVNRTRKGIYVNRDIVDKLHRIVLDVNGEHPTVGSYAEAIIRDHLETCADLIAEMTNDKCSKSV